MPYTIDEINALDQTAFVAALGHLFEHSPWVAAETYAQRPFESTKHLHDELCATLSRASVDSQLELIRAHPDLAGRLAQQGQLTAASTAEQASAGLNRMPAEELAAFTALNTQYRERFGFPFVICARLNDKSTILRAMQARSGNSPEAERAAAITEIEKIAWLRLNDVIKP
jgi:2-oxo-4-hydroxy-4-carboxy-5-ureidoimidazoline decarboxylase